MKNLKLIKIIDQDKSQELINLGFKYVTERMNNQLVHSFFMSEELFDYVNKNFNKKDFLLSNKLTF